jgi:hypothetical protein
MEKSKQNILSAQRRSLDSKQLAVECVINLEGNTNIDKVLALTAHTEIKEQEVGEKETKFFGEIFLNLFYLTEEKELDSVSSVCDFSDVIRHDTLVNGQTIRTSAKIVGVNPTSINEGTLRVLVTVEVSFALEGNSQTSVYDNIDEDCRVQYKESEFTQSSKVYTGKFEVQKVSEVKENITKVLTSSSHAVIKEVTAHDGFIVMEGDVYSYVVYAKEGGNISQVQLVESFKEELEVEESTKSCIVEAKLFSNERESVIEVQEIEGGTSLKLSTGLKAELKIYKSEPYLTTSDIYSLKNKLNVQSETIKTTQLLSPKYFEGKIEGNLTLSESQPRIDKTLAVSSPRYSISNVYFKEDEIFIEGVVSSNLVYLNDETESVNSVEVEVPFVTSEKYMTDYKDLQVNVQIAVSDCDMIAKRGREIYFDCKVRAYANVWAEKEESVISNIERKEAHPEKDSAIEIYFAKNGNTFWEIAKELNVDERLVSGQNPNVKNPLESDEKIVIYYGIR